MRDELPPRPGRRRTSARAVVLLAALVVGEATALAWAAARELPQQPSAAAAASPAPQALLAASPVEPLPTASIAALPAVELSAPLAGTPLRAPSSAGGPKPASIPSPTLAPLVRPTPGVSPSTPPASKPHPIDPLQRRY
jgi:hypothetical protein